MRRALASLVLGVLSCLACESDERSGAVCSEDGDCSPGERCNANEGRCQALSSSGRGQPCSVDEHCADELVCLGTACGIGAYAPCRPGSAVCGQDWFCASGTDQEGGVCTVDCEADADCRSHDSFFALAGFDDEDIRCVSVPAEPPRNWCGLPCESDDDCGASSLTYEGVQYSARCEAPVMLCAWLPPSSE